MAKKTWIVSDPNEMRCDSCSELFQDAFSDIATRFGPWGNFCDRCLPHYAMSTPCAYGTGLGQRYERQGNEWVKVAG